MGVNVLQTAIPVRMLALPYSRVHTAALRVRSADVGGVPNRMREAFLVERCVSGPLPVYGEHSGLGVQIENVPFGTTEGMNAAPNPSGWVRPHTGFGATKL